MLKVTSALLALAVSFAGASAHAHVLGELEIDFLGPDMAVFDELREMLEDSPDTSSSGDISSNSDTSSETVDPASESAATPPLTTATTTPSQPQTMMVGDEVEILNTYNKGGVSQGRVGSPTFTLTEPMMLTYLQTYHWNGGRGMTAPGQIGIKGQGVWQAEGRPGMFDTPNAEWIVTPEVILQPGTYTVIDSSPETWAHNSGSQEVGFVVVRAAPVSGSAAAPTSAPAIETPVPSQATVIGDAREILNTYNKMTVGHGGAQLPLFTLNRPMMLTYLQTYHWNGGRGTPAPGQIGITGLDMWQAEGQPGMGGVPNAEWIAKPNVVLPVGTYTVTTSANGTWAHNSHSDEVGFVVIRVAPVSTEPATAALLTPRLSERQALEQLVGVTRFKDWVLAVRANGHSVVYDLTDDPTDSCRETSCNWCFRMQEDTPSHRTYFETYCVDAMSGKVSAQVE